MWGVGGARMGSIKSTIALFERSFIDSYVRPGNSVGATRRCSVFDSRRRRWSKRPHRSRHSSANGAKRVARVGVLFFGPLWIVYAIALPVLLGGRRTRMAITAAAVVAAVCLSVPFQLHYAAPLTAAFTRLASGALRRLWVYQPNGIRVGRAVVMAAPAVVLWAAVQASGNPPLARRPALMQQLKRSGGTHLILVQYGPNHTFPDKWVYNEPDPGRAAIVWARDLGPERNRELLR